MRKGGQSQWRREASITRHRILRFQRKPVLWTQFGWIRDQFGSECWKFVIYFGLNIGYTIQSFPSDNKISAATCSLSAFYILLLINQTIFASPPDITGSIQLKGKHCFFALRMPKQSCRTSNVTQRSVNRFQNRHRHILFGSHCLQLIFNFRQLYQCFCTD